MNWAQHLKSNMLFFILILMSYLFLSSALANTQQSISSNAFNYSSTMQTSVNPATGTISGGVTLVSLPAKTGIGFNLSMSYQPYTTAAPRYYSIGPWVFNMTYYDADQNTLHLSSGESFPIQNNQLLFYKLKNIVFENFQAGRPLPFNNNGASYFYRVSHLSGEQEFLDQKGNLIALSDRFGNYILFNLAYMNQTEVKLLSITRQDGVQINLNYDDNGCDQSLCVISADNQTNIKVNYEPNLANNGQGLTITYPNGSAYQLVDNDQYLKITYPNNSVTVFQYNSNKLLNQIKQVTCEAHFDSDITVQGNVCLNMALPHLVNPTYYNYPGENNFIGPASENCSSSYDDCLMQSPDVDNNYSYQTQTKQLANDPNVYLVTTTTFNRYHLPIEIDITQQNSQGENIGNVHTKTFLYQFSGNVISAYPQKAYDDSINPNYASPVKIVATYYNDAGASRQTTEQMQYEPNFGVLINKTMTNNTQINMNYDFPELSGYANNWDPDAQKSFGLLATKTVTPPSTDNGEQVYVTTNSLGHTDGSTSKNTVILSSSVATQSGTVIQQQVMTHNSNGQVTSTNKIGDKNAPGAQYGPTALMSYIDYAHPSTSLMTVTKRAGNTEGVECGSATCSIQTVTQIDANRGVLLSETDSLGNVTTIEYNDPLHRPTQKNFPDGSYLTVQYDDANRTVTQSHSSGCSIQLQYDGLGRVIAKYDNAGSGVCSGSPSQLSTTYHYSLSNGKLLSSTNYANGDGATIYNQTINQYDNLGRLVEQKTLDPNGQIIAGFTRQYDPVAATQTDTPILPAEQGDGHFTVKQCFDPINGVLKQKQIQSSVDSKTINAFHSYNSLNQLIRSDLPLSRSTVTYDLSGKASTITEEQQSSEQPDYCE